jgi:hypothetical protein
MSGAFFGRFRVKKSLMLTCARSYAGRNWNEPFRADQASCKEKNETLGDPPMRSRSLLIAALSLLTLVAACPKKGGGYFSPAPAPAPVRSR